MIIFQPKPKQRHETLVPMINIVLLLLIFFMLAGRLEIDSDLTVRPPVSLASADQPLTAPTLSIAANGRMALDGVLIDRTALRSRVAEYVAQTTNTNSLSIKADANATAGQVLDVIDVLRELPIDHIDLLTVTAN